MTTLPLNPELKELPMEDTTRAVIYIATAVIILYDVVCARFGWLTISECMRMVDRQSGGMVRWFWLGLWAHWFINWGKV